MLICVTLKDKITHRTGLISAAAVTFPRTSSEVFDGSLSTKHIKLSTLL